MAKVITVISGKGGVGKSTFAVGVGRVLSKNKKVLLIDGDIAFRSLDILLGLDSMVVFDWSDVIFDRCTPDKARLFASEDLHLLASPLSLNEKVSKPDFEKIISFYDEKYDYIIIDSPAGISAYTKIYSAVADLNIIIATPDDISLRSAYITGDSLSKDGIDDSKMRLVLNKADARQIKKGKQRTPDEAIDKTYLRILGVIPYDKNIIFPENISDFSFSEDTVDAFSNIAARISGKDVKLCT